MKRSVQRSVKVAAAVENTPRADQMRRTLMAVVAMLAIAGDQAQQAFAVSAPSVRLQVPGVVNAFGLGSYFLCTNVGTVPLDMTIQLYDGNGNPVGTPGSATMSPQTSLNFGTGLAAGILVDQNLSAPGMAKGFAKISANTKYLACTAILMDPSASPPASVANLTVIKGKTQKGD